MQSDQEYDVFTYHCICTNLILASPLKLSKQSRRAGEAIDRAYIVPITREAIVLPSTQSKLVGVEEGPAHITRRDDGFEKRYPLRCHRCSLVVGYHLDEAHFTSSETEAGSSTGANHDLIYVLSGGVVGTTDMLAGKDVSESIMFKGLKRGATR